MVNWNHIQLILVFAIVGLPTPSETVTCYSSGISFYPGDCGKQFQQYVGGNYYPAQNVVPGAVCYQGAIINASDPVCAGHLTTGITTSSVYTTTSNASTGGGGGSTTGGTIGDTILSSSFSLNDFNTLFPHASGAAIRGDQNQYAIFTYDNFNEASKFYPDFAGTGDADTRKREVAAFLGQTSHETSGWWPGQPFNWGYFFSTELCSDCQYCSDSMQYPCAVNQSYYGRGPIQISWNYNYGAASSALLGAPTILLDDPDLVLKNGVVAFQTALWFWMTAQPPKPSAHSVITGSWTPSAADIAAGRVVGYGMITNIINGGLECNVTTPTTVESRVGYYLTYTSYFGVSAGENLYCNSTQPY